MATWQLKSSQRRSTVETSRFTAYSEDFESVVADIRKRLYNRQSMSRSSTNGASYGITFPIMPTPMHGFGNKSGYDLRFEIGPKPDHGHVKQHGSSATVSRIRFSSKNLISIANMGNIDLTAVQYSLARKSGLLNSRSWQGEGILSNDESSPVSPSASWGKKNKIGVKSDTVAYKGNLKLTGDFTTIHVARPAPDATTGVSVMVNASSSKVSHETDVLLWPWIDRSRTVEELYVLPLSVENHLEKQEADLPEIPHPLQAFVFLRYLRSIEPCMGEGDFKKMKKKLQEFALNHGARYHDLVVDYLSNRNRHIEDVLPNYNFCFDSSESALSSLAVVAPFCHDIWPEKDDSLLDRAAIVTRMIGEFWDLLRTERLKTVVDDQGNACNMRHFRNLFNSVKLPGLPASAPCSFFKTKCEGDTPRHIIVIHRSRVFVMNIADENFNILSIDEIKISLRELMLFASGHTDNPVGILTATDVRSWATTRQRLAHVSENNASNLIHIERAIFVLSLEHKNVRGLDMLANEAVFGDGCNRWYDKSVNVYIHNNGFVTVNGNRALVDSHAMAHMLNYVHLRIVEDSERWTEDIRSSYGSDNSTSSRRLSNADTVKLQRTRMAESASNTATRSRVDSLTATECTALHFDIDSFIDGEIERSASTFSILSFGLLTAICKNDTLDSHFFMQYNINKDALAHMIIHLAFYKMYFRIPSVGAKVSLKKFAGVHYDTLRSTTPEMAAWCRSMLDKTATEAGKADLFRKAEKAHGRLLKECFNGMGCDSYMNVLKNICEDDRCSFDDSDNLFNSATSALDGWSEGHDVNTESLGIGCTGCPVVLPVSPQGYGIGYCVANSFLLFIVTSCVGNVSTSADLYAASLQATLRQVYESIYIWNARRRPLIIPTIVIQQASSHGGSSHYSVNN